MHFTVHGHILDIIRFCRIDRGLYEASLSAVLPGIHRDQIYATACRGDCVPRGILGVYDEENRLISALRFSGENNDQIDIAPPAALAHTMN